MNISSSVKLTHSFLVEQYSKHISAYNTSVQFYIELYENAKQKKNASTFIVFFAHAQEFINNRFIERQNQGPNIM